MCYCKDNHFTTWFCSKKVNNTRRQAKVTVVITAPGHSIEFLLVCRHRSSLSLHHVSLQLSCLAQSFLPLIKNLQKMRNNLLYIQTLISINYTRFSREAVFMQWPKLLTWGIVRLGFFQPVVLYIKFIYEISQIRNAFLLSTCFAICIWSVQYSHYKTYCIRYIESVMW